MKRRNRHNADDDDNGFAKWGGYMEAKKSKLLEQFSDDAKNESNKRSNLFKGISIFVNGYTIPTAEELKQIMSLHGGVFHTYHMPAKTTHIIASNLPDVKVKQLGSTDRIVKPEWISESLKAGRILDFRNYLLYTNRNRKQPRLNFERFEKNVSDPKATTEKNLEKDRDNIPSHQLTPELFPFSDDDIHTDQNETENENRVDQKVFHETKINNSDINVTIKQNDGVNTKISDCLKDKTNRTRTAVDPKFLSEFYNNSRLHHIATLGATFKQHVCNLRENSNGTFPERQKLVNYLQNIKKHRIKNEAFITSKEPVIMHIDMDCFFVSVGLRKRPELRGLPIAVTHSKGGQEPSARSGVDRQAELECYKQRIQDKLKPKAANQLGPGNMLSRLENIENQSMSEIASCSYEARKAGVKNGMFMGTALQLCPNLQTIPYDFEEYKEVAYTLYNTIAEYTLNIEGVSCDEMFVDITELLEKTGASVAEWATYIRSLIQSRTGCPCSTGFGSNRLQARMATRTAKPNGQFHLEPSAVEEYMINISVDDLPGVGRSTSLKLTSVGIKTCGDLQAMNLGKLRTEFGTKVGETLYNHCRGIDDKPLIYEHERKSVSAEVNYGIRFKNNVESETFLKQLAAEVHARLMEIKMKGKCITLKLMIRSKGAPVESSKYMGHGVCDYINKSTTLSSAVNDLDIITREVLSLAQKLAIPPSELRGIGIQISRLEKGKKTGSSTALTKFLTTVNTSNNKSKDVNTTDLKLSSDNVKLDASKTNDPETKDLRTATICIQPNLTSTNHLDATVFKKPEIIVPLNKIQTKSERTSQAQNNDNTKVEQICNNKKSEQVVTSTKNKTVSQNQVSKRGRPKGKSNRTIIRKNSNNGSLDKFLAPPETNEPILPADIDMEVFAELPEDIRKEILQQYNIKDTKIYNNVTNTSPKEANNNKINVNNKEFSNEKSPKRTEVNSMNNGCMFSEMTVQQMKTLFQDWVSSQHVPEPCDVKILGNYFRQMALDKKIDDLYMMLKFLYSEILFKMDCFWHKTYLELVNRAQEGMIASYGSAILVYQDFNCEKMCHLSKS